MDSERYHASCAAFLIRLADEQVEIGVSELLEVELAHASVRVARHLRLEPPSRRPLEVKGR